MYNICMEYRRTIELVLNAQFIYCDFVITGKNVCLNNASAHGRPSCNCMLGSTLNAELIFCNLKKNLAISYILETHKQFSSYSKVMLAYLPTIHPAKHYSVLASWYV